MSQHQKMHPEVILNAQPNKSVGHHLVSRGSIYTETLTSAEKN